MKHVQSYKTVQRRNILGNVRLHFMNIYNATVYDVCLDAINLK